MSFKEEGDFFSLFCFFYFTTTSSATLTPQVQHLEMLTQGGI